MNQVPWICDSCGHFMVADAVRVAEQGPPRHERTVAGFIVAFVAYESSEQAAEIARRVPPTRRVSVL